MKTDATLPEIYVQPGESHLVTKPTVLRTVLGSCVGVAFRAEAEGVAAICHPMLPQQPAVRSDSKSSRRYVDYAIREIAAKFDALGIRRNEVCVKLFGGADVLLVSDDATRPTVGKLNGEAAERVLREEGFMITACSLGGKRGMHLQFHTGTGEVVLRRLN